MKILGEGQFEAEPRYAVLWDAGKTETPIRVNLNGANYALNPGEETIVPESLKMLFDDSGFDVTIIGEATAVEEAEDATPVEASGDGADDGDNDNGESSEKPDTAKKSPKA